MKTLRIAAVLFVGGVGALGLWSAWLQIQGKPGLFVENVFKAAN